MIGFMFPIAFMFFLNISALKQQAEKKKKAEELYKKYSKKN